MNYISLLQKVFEVDLISTFFNVFIIIIGFLLLKKVFTQLFDSIDYELPWVKKKRLNAEFQKMVIEQLTELENRRKEDVENSIKHDERIEESVELLTAILEKHDAKEKEHTVVSLRSTLWRIHTESMAQKYITPEGLKTFMECGRVYEEAGGDDIYHSKLEPDILSLPIQEH